MEPADDHSILARIAAGDEQAAEAFDRQFRVRLLRFTRNRNIPIQDQTDLIQDVLLTAFQQIKEDKFHRESSIGTWLVGILNHKIADYWEQHGREVRRLTPAENTDEAGVQLALDRVPDLAPHPDVALELRELLASLPKEHRVVLLLSVTEGWSTEEMAVILKRPPGTVGRILWEAKQMLRKNRRLLKTLALGTRLAFSKYRYI